MRGDWVRTSTSGGNKVQYINKNDDNEKDNVMIMTCKREWEMINGSKRSHCVKFMHVYRR